MSTDDIKGEVRRLGGWFIDLFGAARSQVPGGAIPDMLGQFVRSRHERILREMLGSLDAELGDEAKADARLRAANDPRSVQKVGRPDFSVSGQGDMRIRRP